MCPLENHLLVRHIRLKAFNLFGEKGHVVQIDSIPERRDAHERHAQWPLLFGLLHLVRSKLSIPMMQ